MRPANASSAAQKDLAHTDHSDAPTRNLLRADPALAAEYEALKRELAERYGDDREAYTEAKSRFITGHERP
jgi:GrpB-like predicted nucleotidyltransferase (UPF0157 family)